MTGNSESTLYHLVGYRREGEDGWHLKRRWAAGTHLPPTQKYSPQDHRTQTTANRVIAECWERPDADEDPAQLSASDCEIAQGHGWIWDDRIAAWHPPEDLIAILPAHTAADDTLAVTFGPAEHGWQPVTITTTQGEVEFEASADCDPFPQILGWLEAVARGEQTRIAADLERVTVEFFGYTLPDPSRIRLIVAFLPGQHGAHRDVALDVAVDRHHFVSTFYRAFRGYATSDRYSPDEWAAMTMRDDMLRKNCPCDPVQLATLSASGVNDILWSLYPNTLISFPDDPRDAACIDTFLDHIQGRKTRHKPVEEPDPQFTVPETFDSWDEAQRIDFVQRMLDEIVTPYGGCDLAGLRSKSLERYLEMTPESGPTG